MTNPISRTITFHKFLAKDDNELNISFQNIKSLFSYIDGLSKTVMTMPPTIQCGFVEQEGQYLCMRKVEIASDRLFGILDYARNDELPLIMHERETSPMQLPPNNFICEPTHFMLYDNGVLLMEWNNHGPKWSALEEYLRKISPDCKDIQTIKSISTPRIDLLHNYNFSSL